MHQPPGLHLPCSLALLFEWFEWVTLPGVLFILHLANNCYSLHLASRIARMTESRVHPRWQRRSGGQGLVVGTIPVCS